MFAVLILSASVVRAQTRDLAALEGHVLDEQGKAIAGAQVKLTNVDTGAERATQSDAQGKYGFAGVSLTGHYTIAVNASNFNAAEQQNVDFVAGVTATVNFTMSVSGSHAEVTVYGTTQGVQTDSNQIIDRLDLPKIENTPILSNKLTSLSLLDSSVRPSHTTGDLFTNETLIVINGGGRRQTTFSIDNADADDSWGRQTIFTTLPFATVEEFDVVTNSSSAEYGRNAGSAVNVVTKSGTNNYHGDFIGMGRPGWSEASIPQVSPLALTKATDTFADGSGALSGPIIKDRTSFLIGAEINEGFRDAVITSPFDLGAIFPGHFQQELGFVRIDHELTSNNHLTLRANMDRFFDTNPQDNVSGVTLPSAARTFVKHTYSTVLTDVATLSPSVVNEAKLQYAIGDPITQFVPQFPQPQVSLSGFYTYGDSRFANLANRQFEEGDTLTMIHGRHTIKVGADLIESSSGGFGQEFGSGYLDGQWAVNNPACFNYSTISPTQVIADLQANTAGAPPQAMYVPSATCTAPATPPPALINTYTQTFGNQTYNIKETLFSGFVQDDFKLRPDLTINAGLRYEGQTWLGDFNNVAPRLGFAWRLPHTKATVLRGGYGIYYSEIRADEAAGYEEGGPQGLFTFVANPGKCGYPSTFAPFASLAALLASPNCTSPSGAAQVPERNITINEGDTTYLSQYFNVSALHFYPSRLLNPYTQQWTLGVQHEIARGWILSADYVGSLSLKLERPDDLNAPSAFIRTAQGQTRSAAVANATRPIQPTTTCTTQSATYNASVGNCFNNYAQISAIINQGTAYYDGLQMKLTKQFSHNLSLLASYTYSHAINDVEPDAAGQSPNDWNLLGPQYEKGTSILDQRHRAVISGYYQMPWGFSAELNSQFASGLPYAITVGSDVSGEGATPRPIVNGFVLARDSGSGTPTYEVDPALQKSFKFGETFRVNFRAEAFNVFNHFNVFGRNGTYGNNATPASALGAPLSGIANVGPSRQLQFQMRLLF
ncbi:MAG TPA: carboxypeptidase regulatory-like domain-containing protein [Candidatus Acidoferrales bacterium]|nr:carboxypeptidase regulatory-like domain-containing protein [Candidatus Acidoferrales bacterium]